jgi:cytochrome c oxidase cbb3-type subunit 3
VRLSDKYRLGIVAMLVTLAACSKEARTLAPDLPQTPPLGAADPRIPKYQDTIYQVAQGGRYFIWAGCGACHAAGATGARDLGDGHWRHGSGFDQVYASIAYRHPARRYAEAIPVEQLWQITAYVRDLSRISVEKRRRADHDQQNEPQGATWTGAAR